MSEEQKRIPEDESHTEGGKPVEALCQWQLLMVISPPNLFTNQDSLHWRLANARRQGMRSLDDKRNFV